MRIRIPVETHETVMERIQENIQGLADAAETDLDRQIADKLSEVYALLERRNAERIETAKRLMAEKEAGE